MIPIDVLKNFRLKFGLSQYEAARLLNTTRSQLAMAERGIRPIPIDVGIRLLEITEQLNASKKEEQRNTAGNEEVDQQDPLWMLELDEEFKVTRFQLSLVTEELNRLEQTHHQLKAHSLEREELIRVLKQQQTDAAFLRNGTNTIQKKLSSCKAVNKQRLLLQRDLLLAKANVISQYLGKGSN